MLQLSRVKILQSHAFLLTCLVTLPDSLACHGLLRPAHLCINVPHGVRISFNDISLQEDVVIVAINYFISDVLYDH